MSEFKWRHYHGTVILQCARWYCKYGISYRDLEEMMEERGVEVDHSTLYRWVQRYARNLRRKFTGTREIGPILGFKSIKIAYAKIKGFEVMRMFKKRQFRIWMHGETGQIAEVRYINRLFGVYA